MDGCPHRTFWRFANAMQRKVNDVTLTYLRCTTPIHLLPQEFGCLKLASDQTVQPTYTELAGAQAALVSLSRSCIMEAQPVSGLVEQSTDGSLSTSCPEGQWALTGIDYAEVELRVLSLRTYYQRSKSQRPDTAALPYLEQVRSLLASQFLLDTELPGGSTETRRAEKGS